MEHVKGAVITSRGGANHSPQQVDTAATHTLVTEIQLRIEAAYAKLVDMDTIQRAVLCRIFGPVPQDPSKESVRPGGFAVADLEARLRDLESIVHQLAENTAQMLKIA